MFVPPQDWFEMAELRRRWFADAVWIPLACSETLLVSGERNRIGSQQEVLAAGSVCFAPGQRSLGENLGWSRLSGPGGGPYAFADGRYKRAEAYQEEDGVDAGVHLVFVQGFVGDHPRIWHVNQDLVLALGLLVEGDRWVRPEEGYVEVMRQRRDASGRVVAIEIKREFLADYLAARGLALRLNYYRQRLAVLDDVAHLTWRNKPLYEIQPHNRFQAEVFEIDAAGGPHGADVAVFEIWRTDVDDGAEVPIFGPEEDDNTAGRSRSFTRDGPKFFQVEGELWRGEWIEPAPRSERVRRDPPVEILSYIVDGAGVRLSATDLDHESVGRYLWFRPEVVPALIGRRGGSLNWYSSQTGSVACSPDHETHFGVNPGGLVNVYAYDIAKLPAWQQRIWHGHNVSPEGGVAQELLASQMACRPADTIAPEVALARALVVLDAKASAWLGQPLLRSHPDIEDIQMTTHRFRALNKAGLLALAKDVARLTAERIEMAPLRSTVVPPKGENWGGLKSLEKALSTLVPPEAARSLLSPLVGAYELRKGDAHLASSDLPKAWSMAGVDPDAPWPWQGAQLINACALALTSIAEVMPTSDGTLS